MRVPVRGTQPLTAQIIAAATALAASSHMLAIMPLPSLSLITLLTSSLLLISMIDSITSSTYRAPIASRHAYLTKIHEGAAYTFAGHEMSNYNETLDWCRDQSGELPVIASRH